MKILTDKEYRRRIQKAEEQTESRVRREIYEREELDRINKDIYELKNSVNELRFQIECLKHPQDCEFERRNDGQIN